MSRALECFDEKPPKCGGGGKGLTKSINCIVNLANLAHYIQMMKKLALVYGVKKRIICQQKSTL